MKQKTRERKKRFPDRLTTSGSFQNIISFIIFFFFKLIRFKHFYFSSFLPSSCTLPTKKEKFYCSPEFFFSLAILSVPLPSLFLPFPPIKSSSSIDFIRTLDHELKIFRPLFQLSPSHALNFYNARMLLEPDNNNDLQQLVKRWVSNPLKFLFSSKKKEKNYLLQD